MAKPAVMQNLYRRGKSPTLYAKFSYMGVDVIGSTKTTDPKLAQQWIENKKREIYMAAMNPTPVVSKSGTIRLSEALENVFEDKWKLTRNSEYGDQQYQKIAACIEILGDIDLEELNTEVIRNLKRSLRQLTYQGKMITEATVQKYVVALRTLYLHHAEKHNLKPIKWEIKKKQVCQQRVRVYSQEEEQMIIEWFQANKLEVMADLCVLLSETGLRLSECLGIGKVSNGKLITEVNLEKKQVTSWINKGGHPRTIPLLRKSLTILERRGKIAFPLLEKRTVEWYWARMRKALDLGEDCVMHVYRHTCASRLLRSGCSLKEVQEWLGHADLRTTEIYLHLMPNALQKAAERLDKMVA